MSSSKRKGMRVERELVRELGKAGLEARRQPGSGVYADFPHDIQLIIRGERYIVECKARREGFRQLDGWLGQADILIVKLDRQPPCVYLPWRVFLELAAGEGGAAA